MDKLPYNTMIDLSQKNNSHTLAFELISTCCPCPGRVLEVGCATGYFGAALARAGYDVVGIEPHAPSAATASQVMPRVFCGTVAEYLAKFGDGKPFDAIVFGDVLAHLSDPLLVLRECLQLLKDGGCLVCSVPNVSHISVRAMLLQGQWDYQDLGILDRTHLRFFTRKTLLELMAQAGYGVEMLTQTRCTAREAAQLAGNDVNETMCDRVTAVAGDDPDLYTFQFVLLARKAPSGTPVVHPCLTKGRQLRVLATGPDVGSGLFDLRLHTPLRLWAMTCSANLRVRPYQKISLRDEFWADVLVMQREITPAMLKLAKRWRRNGKCVIYDLDDLLFDLPDFLGRHHPDAVNGRAAMIEAIRTASAVSASTPRLAGQIAVHNPAVFVTPNYFEPSDRVPITHRPDRPCTLLVASSDNVKVDFILPAIQEVLAQHGDRVLVRVAGPIQEAFLRAGIPIEAHPRLSKAKFVDWLHERDDAIGLIPLDDSLFSSCKSAIKYFDYSMAGIPTIASAVPPYADVIHDGVDGRLVANDPSAWVAAINALLSDAPRRAELAQHARTSVMHNHNLGKALDSWTALFDALSISAPVVHDIGALPPGLRGRWVALVNKLIDASLPLENKVKNWNHRRIESRRRSRSVTP